jgi:hypothetical protein
MLDEMIEVLEERTRLWLLSKEKGREGGENAEG